MLTRSVFFLGIVFLSAGTILSRNTSAEEKEEVVTLTAVGDVLLDRRVGKVLASASYKELLADVAPTLKKADIAFCNLEFPFVFNPSPIPKPNSFAVPPRYTALLNYAGFDIVSLANNHTMDCGKNGLAETMRHLCQANIAFCGAGRNEKEATTPTVLTIKGVRIGFLAYCDFSPEGVFRLPEAPSISVLQDETLIGEVTRAKQNVDILVVSFHWGREFYPRPTARQRRLAEEAVNAGADIILGHHPHVLQPIEVRNLSSGRRALIAYSLGNFIFDTKKEGSDQTIILECILTKAGFVGYKTHQAKINHCFPKLSDNAQ